MNRSLYACLLLAAASASFSTLGQEASEKKPSIDECIQALKEAPAVENSPKLINYNMSQIQNKLDREFKETKLNRIQFDKVFNIANQADSDNFSTCIDSAVGDALKADPSSLPLDLFLAKKGRSMAGNDIRGLYLYGKRNPDKPPRYLFSDSYQRKYFMDFTEKTYYQLIRVPPPGTIEALGTWQGTFVDPVKCKNSWGDPCGSKYIFTEFGYQKVE